MNRFVKFTSFVLITSLLLLNIQCTEHCANRLKGYSFPYEPGTTVNYKNSSDSVIPIIVQMFANDIESETYQHGNEGHYECSAVKVMYIGDFNYTYSQGVNSDNNAIDSASGFGDFTYTRQKTVDYSFNGQTIKASYHVIDTSCYWFQYYNKLDSLEKYGSYYYDYYLSPDKKLLQYSIKKRDTL